MVTLAQLAEHWIVIPRAAGSNPVRHPIFLTLAQLEERDATNVEVAGSIPAGGSIQGTCRPRAVFP